MSREHNYRQMKRNTPQTEQAGPGVRYVPLGDLAKAQLIFVRGADQLTLLAEPTLAVLAEASYEHWAPDMALVDGQLRVRQRRPSLAQRARSTLLWGRATTRLRLATRVPWRLTVQGGLARFHADLRGLVLQGFTVMGGASAVTLDLPAPQGVVPLQIEGGARAVIIRRPPEVPVRLVVASEATQLALDTQHRSVASAGTQLVAGAIHAPDRYEVTVRGGTSGLTVDTW